MAITDRQTLLAAVANWLNRTDLTDRIPEFVQLAEDEIARTLRQDVVRADLTIASDDVALPDTLAELRSVRLKAANGRQYPPMQIGTVQQLQDARLLYGTVTGAPRFAAVVNERLQLVPAPDRTYTAEITYYAELTRLAYANNDSTNVELTNASDLYLYGALVQAEPYLENDDRADRIWRPRFERALAQLNDQRQRKEFSAALAPVRLPRVFG